MISPGKLESIRQSPDLRPFRSRRTPRHDLRSENTQRHALQAQGLVAIRKVQAARRSFNWTTNQTGQAAEREKRIQAKNTKTNPIVGIRNSTILLPVSLHWTYKPHENLIKPLYYEAGNRSID